MIPCLSAESLQWKTTLEVDIFAVLTSIYMDRFNLNILTSLPIIQYFITLNLKKLGFTIGITELLNTDGDSLTFLVLHSSTSQVIACSVLNSRLTFTILTLKDFYHLERSLHQNPLSLLLNWHV
jgi:hypothetical protein